MWLLIFINLTGKVAALLIGWTAPGPAFALWLVPDLLVAYHVFSPAAQGIVRMHRRFSTSRREVWLTIDDGPDPEDTPRILAALAEHEARATFFLIGENGRRYPELVRAIVAGGHEVGHHTQTHPLAWFWCATPRQVARELDDGLESLRHAGVQPTRFRSPAGIKNFALTAALRRRNLAAIGWSARGLERWFGNPERVTNRVLSNLDPGSILLLHEGPRVPNPIRVTAIEQVLTRLSRDGYTCIVPSPEQLLT